MQEKTQLKIDWATHEAAKTACHLWHYSQCIPVNKLVKIGVWEDSKFIGVVLFGYGAGSNIAKPYGLKMTECCELVRIALDKHETPVTRIMSIAIKFLKKHCPGIKLIVSYADQNEGHHGGIYQGANWIYTGISASTWIYVDPDGKRWHSRRASESPHPEKKTVTSEWKKERQLGKYKYLFPLDDLIKKKIEVLRKPYPKRASRIESSTSDLQSEGGGESPTDALQLLNSHEQPTPD